MSRAVRSVAGVDRQRARVREVFRTLRRNVIDLFGGKCVRCGFADHRALQIDHINGQGHQERLSLAHYAFYRRLLLMPIEERTNRYQLLCANCNWIKRSENNETNHLWRKKHGQF